ncbi:MAG: glycosyltransferase family 4 protein [Thermodesulfovibrionales bacterium]
MNILLLNVALGRGWGGIESHSDTLGSLLSKKGHAVVLGCWDEGSRKVAGGIVLSSKKIWIANSGDVRAIAKIIWAVLKEKVDVIIANGGREYWPAAVAAKITGARLIFIRHQVDRLKRTTCWLINRSVDKVIAVSSAVEKALIQSGVSRGKIEVIYNSIALERFSPDLIDRDAVRKELGIDSDTIVVGTAGKLNPGKGVFDLLSAVHNLMGKYSAAKLMFVGDGPERNELEEEAESLSMRDRVIFTGMRKDIERMYAAMDIFVLPSSCQEAFGMVLIEAMAMGKPVIATAVGGIPEVIENEVNGILVPPQDTNALAHAILRYMDDRTFADRVALEGRKSVEDKFSDKAMGDHFERVLQTIVRSIDNRERFW